MQNARRAIMHAHTRSQQSKQITHARASTASRSRTYAASPTAERGHGGADERCRASTHAGMAAWMSAAERGRARRSRPQGRARARRRGRALLSEHAHAALTHTGTAAWTSTGGRGGAGRTAERWHDGTDERC
jgi:hypothetical protein